jgi:hypothetical protein
MSKINTGGIDTDYPVVGVVNTTEQFRLNWQNMVQNLDQAGQEITDLQDKTLVKAPLANTALDNNMAGTLISNALVSTFRHTTRNLGNNLSGTVVVDVSAADVQYMTATGPIELSFTGWPSVTSNQQSVQSNVQVIVNQSPDVAQTAIYFPPQVCFGTQTLENYSGSGQGGYVTFPANVSQLHYNFTSTTQGATVEVQPLDRPRTSNAFRSGTVTSVILQGQGFAVSNGTIATSGTATVRNTGVTSIAAGNNISVSGSTGAVTVTNTLALSQVPQGVPNATGSLGDTPGAIRTDGQYLYVCTGTYDGYTAIWKRANLTS